MNVEMIRDVLYDRNKTLYNKDAVGRIHVVGVGGIGSWVSIFAAMHGCRDIHVYDGDDLDLTNLNRLPFSIDDVGDKKTTVVSRFIERVRPKNSCGVVVTEHDVVSDSNDLKDVRDGDVVVICVDSAEQNNLIMNSLKEKKNVKIIRGAYNGDKITVMDGGEQWVIDGEVGGYGSVPSYLAPPTVVSSLIMEKIYRPGSAEIDINAVPLKNLNGKSE